jgi:type IV pilus assembly protein PilM
LSFEQAEGVKRGLALPEGVEPRPIQPIIEAVSDSLALEVRKTMDFYRTTAADGEATIQKILLAGGGSKLPGVADYLAKRFEIPVEVFDAFRQIEVDTNRFDPDYMKEIVPEMAVAVGLALRGVEA